MDLESTFVPSLLLEKVKLSPKFLNKTYEAKILSILVTKNEGKCSRHGYIKKKSIEIVQLSIGTIESHMLHGYVIFNVKFKALVCNPVIGSVIPCVVKNSNNFGVLCTSSVMEENGETTSVINVIVPKNSVSIRSALSVDLNLLERGSVINVEIIGKKFEINDTKISAVGKVVEQSNDIHVDVDDDDLPLETFPDEDEIYVDDFEDTMSVSNEGVTKESTDSSHISKKKTKKLDYEEGEGEAEDDDEGDDDEGDDDEDDDDDKDDNDYDTDIVDEDDDNEEEFEEDQNEDDDVEPQLEQSVFKVDRKSKHEDPGKGESEILIDTDDFTELKKVKHWRRLLSTSHECDFTHNQRRYRTIEHAIQSRKLSSIDEKVGFKFSLDSNSGLSKGTSVQAITSGNKKTLSVEQLNMWMEVKDAVINEILMDKYSQCEVPRNVLLLTQNSQIFEQEVRMYPLEQVREQLRV